jgi:hypothetical protein
VRTLFVERNTPMQSTPGCLTDRSFFAAKRMHHPCPLNGVSVAGRLRRQFPVTAKSFHIASPAIVQPGMRSSLAVWHQKCSAFILEKAPKQLATF